MSQPFVIKRWYNAPLNIVWDAISNKQKMQEWYFDLPEFKAEPGFEFEFVAGSEEKKYRHQCKVTEVITGKKLAYTWRYPDYPGNSLVTFEPFAEGDKTKVKLTHEGLETFTTDNPDFAKESFSEGWNHIIGSSLKEYVEA